MALLWIKIVRRNEPIGRITTCNESKVVRIHVALPKTIQFSLVQEKKISGALKRSCEKKDDLLLYLDASNIHDLLGDANLTLYQ